MNASKLWGFGMVARHGLWWQSPARRNGDTALKAWASADGALPRRAGFRIQSAVASRPEGGLRCTQESSRSIIFESLS